MKTIDAQEGERLDQITFREYGTLDVFDKVIEANPDLTSKLVLEHGDKVNIPIVEYERYTAKEVKTLW